MPTLLEHTLTAEALAIFRPDLCSRCQTGIRGLEMSNFSFPWQAARGLCFTASRPKSGDEGWEDPQNSSHGVGSTRALHTGWAGRGNTKEGDPESKPCPLSPTAPCSWPESSEVGQKWLLPSRPALGAQWKHPRIHEASTSPHPSGRSTLPTLTAQEALWKLPSGATFSFSLWSLLSDS